MALFADDPEELLPLALMSTQNNQCERVQRGIMMKTVVKIVTTAKRKRYQEEKNTIHRYKAL